MKTKDLEKLGLTKEFIAEHGLPEDLITQILTIHGKDIESQKSTIAQLEASNETLTTQLDTANKEIKSYKDMDIEAIKKQSADWERKATDFQVNAEKEKAQLRLEFAVRTALTNDYRAKDANDVIPYIDLSTVKLNNDGTLVGLKEQMESEKITKKNYLFNEAPAEGDTEDEDTTSNQPAPKFAKGTSAKSKTAEGDGPINIREAISNRLSEAAKQK